jgi:hypothetical protein
LQAQDHQLITLHPSPECSVIQDSNPLFGGCAPKIRPVYWCDPGHHFVFLIPGLGLPLELALLQAILNGNNSSHRKDHIVIEDAAILAVADSPSDNVLPSLCLGQFAMKYRPQLYTSSSVVCVSVVIMTNTKLSGQQC